ncbi:MAG TPA: sigma-70 family RNA polymerase sigma factor [Candidatus Angelobacter sp.]
MRLLLATRDEDLRADLWVEFWRRFQPVIARTVRRRIARYTRWVDLGWVDDLVGETFFKICKDNYKALRKFEFQHENALYGFLKVLAAHVVEDDIRKKNSEKEGGGQAPENIDDLTQPPSDRFSAAHSMLNNLRMNEIESCLQQRKGEPNFVRDHKTFWLYFRDGFTASEISELPDIGFKSVKGVESALLRLSKWLGDCLN